MGDRLLAELLQLWIRAPDHVAASSTAVLARIAPSGPACHTGEMSCFGEATDVPAGTLARLDATLAGLATERPGGFNSRFESDDQAQLSGDPGDRSGNWPE